jgi:hypothetical protein
MITLESIRRAIEAAPADGEALLPVTRSQLEDLERELVAGRAAIAEITARRGGASHGDVA